MIRRCCTILFISCIGLFLVSTAFADPRVGKLLEEALESRETGTVSDVSDKFLAAADAGSNANQRSKVLFLFSDYLLAHREWEKAIHVQHSILELGDQESQAGALYNLIWANLELNQPEEAQKAATELNACPSGDYMREHARNMKQLSPTSIHAQISDMLVSAPAASKSMQACWNSSGEEKNPNFVADSSQPQCQLPPSAETAPVDEKSASVTPQPVAQPEKEFTNQVEVELGGWRSELGGDIDSQGNSLDFGDDVSSDHETSLVLAVKSTLSPKDSVKLTYVNFGFDGTLNKTFVHNTRNYTPGDSFELRTTFIDLEGFRKWKERSRTNVGFLYGAMFVNSVLEVSQSLPGVRRVSTWESRFGYPYIGLTARSNSRGSVGFDASIKWFSWNGNGQYNTHDFQLKLLLGQNSSKNSDRKWWGYIGYRDFRWSGDFDDDTGGVHFSGPIFGLEFAI